MTDENEQIYSADELRRFTSECLAALGAADSIADQVAASLVLSNLVGHDSHGVIRIVQYSEWVRDGQIRPAAVPQVRRKRGSTAVVDGGWGFGQPAARLAADLARQIGSEHGIAAIAIAECNHIGRLGEYVGALADAGFMGLAWCNSGPVVAPFGGTGRALGTNPFAWAAPSGDAHPLVVDFSTAGVAEGKLRIARANGRTVGPGLIVDPAGMPTVEPADFFAGGALLPFGGHKGSGMSVMIELLGGVLTGMGVACSPRYAGGNGTIIMAIDVAAFVDPLDFASQAAEFRQALVAAGRGPSGGEVIMPGEIEMRTYDVRVRDGIPVSRGVQSQIYAISDALGVSRAAPRPRAAPSGMAVDA
jgi:LDH2 family malate/lactate/ureidoglycolate dehydrogenase